MQWFRMYSEFATDPVVQSLSFDDQRHFVVILCLKSSGVLDKEFGHPQVRNDVIRKTLGLDGVAFQEAKSRLCGSLLIDGDWQPTNWNKRQFISDSTDPTAAERMRRYRANHRNDTVTLRPSESDTETYTEKKEEGNGRSRAPTAKRLPKDFELTDERRRTARMEDVDPDREFSKFSDHWHSASGANARKHDWDAAWRNWCRKAADYRPKAGKSEIKWRPTDEESGTC